MPDLQKYSFPNREMVRVYLRLCSLPVAEGKHHQTTLPQSQYIRQKFLQSTFWHLSDVPTPKAIVTSGVGGLRCRHSIQSYRPQEAPIIFARLGTGLSTSLSSIYTDLKISEISTSTKASLWVKFIIAVSFHLPPISLRSRVRRSGLYGPFDSLI